MPDLAQWVVTLLILALAAGLLLAQSHYSAIPGSLFSLSQLDERVPLLQAAGDPVRRDRFCIPLSGFGRALDQALPNDARVFLGGMIGKTNGGGLGYYYFLRNYLFPRNVEISLGGNAVFKGDYFEGIPCDDPKILQSNGFDLLIAQGPNGLQLTPLTQKGVPKQ